MSVQASTWVWEHSRATGNTLLVLLAIADQASKDGRDAWPGQKRIAAKCRLSVRTVRRCIDELVALEELVVTKYGGPVVDGRAGRRTHRYALTMLAANLSPNPDDVVGQVGKVGGQTDPSCGTQLCPGNRPSKSSLKTSSLARDGFSSREEELVTRAVDHFGPKSRKRVKGAIKEALEFLDWRKVDEAIGLCEKHDAYSVTYLENAIDSAAKNVGINFDFKDFSSPQPTCVSCNGSRQIPDPNDLGQHGKPGYIPCHCVTVAA